MGLRFNTRPSAEPTAIAATTKNTAKIRLN
jgi:hypothetical protein